MISTVRWVIRRHQTLRKMTYNAYFEHQLLEPLGTIKSNSKLVCTKHTLVKRMQVRAEIIYLNSWIVLEFDDNCVVLQVGRKITNNQSINIRLSIDNVTSAQRTHVTLLTRSGNWYSSSFSGGLILPRWIKCQR